MDRIPQDELEQVKREVSVLDRVRAAGVALKRHGVNWVGRWLDRRRASNVPSNNP